MGNPANVVMIVSSAESEAKEIEGLVAKFGCKVHFAKDGNEVLFKMENVVPTVLITDLELHKHFSGKKLIENVLRNKRFEALSIIVTSAATNGEFCVNQVASGQVQFVPKPLCPETFERAMQKALLRNPANSQSLEYRQRFLAPGELLFREGENAELAFLLKSGKLRATRCKDGKTEILGEILPGEFVGEMAYINGEPRSASVEAVTTSELVEIPLQNLDSIVFSKPAWSKALLKTISKRLKAANSKRAA